MYEKILIALEGKATDEAVLLHVQALAAQTRSELTLLRVITVADDEAGGLGLQIQLEIGSSGWRRRQQAEKRFDLITMAKDPRLWYKRWIGGSKEDLSFLLGLPLECAGDILADFDKQDEALPCRGGIDVQAIDGRPIHPGPRVLNKACCSPFWAGAQTACSTRAR
jgi:hypothetical protein